MISFIFFFYLFFSNVNLHTHFVFTPKRKLGGFVKLLNFCLWRSQHPLGPELPLETIDFTDPVQWTQTHPPLKRLWSICIYKHKVDNLYLSVCLFVFLIIIHKPLDWFASNFDWGTRENHGNVLSMVLRFWIEWVHFSMEK